MKAITIVPTAYLECTKGASMHMALAPMFSDPVYKNFYHSEAIDGAYIILDNGVIEGNPRPIEEIVELATTMGFHEIVLPDTLFDRRATLTSTYAALDVVNALNPDLKCMAVPQGADDAEWLKCAHDMMKMGVTIFGVPKWLSVKPNKRFYARAFLAEQVLLMLQQNGVDGEIHFLGSNEGVTERRMLSQSIYREKFRSVDSILPYLLAKEGFSMNFPRGTAIANFNDEYDEKVALQLGKNMVDWTGGVR